MTEIPHKGCFQFSPLYTFECPTNQCGQIITVPIAGSLIIEALFDTVDCPTCHTKYRVKFQLKPDTRRDQSKPPLEAEQNSEMLTKLAWQLQKEISVKVEHI